MIKLYQYPRAFGLPNASPPCMKIEGLLRFAKLPHEIVYIKSAAQSPTGRLPFIDDGTKTVVESTLIMEYLFDNYEISIDDHLSAEERALSTAWIRCFDYHLYWLGVYSRFGDDRNYPSVRKAFFGKMKPPLKWVVPIVLRRSMKQRLRGMGYGLQDEKALYDLGARDLKRVSDFLGDKPFMMGDKLSTLDAAAYAYLANVMLVPIESPLKDACHECSNFGPYLERMKNEWEKSAPA